MLKGMPSSMGYKYGNLEGVQVPFAVTSSSKEKEERYSKSLAVENPCYSSLPDSELQTRRERNRDTYSRVLLLRILAILASPTLTD